MVRTFSPVLKCQASPASSDDFRYRFVGDVNRNLQLISIGVANDETVFCPASRDRFVDIAAADNAEAILSLEFRLEVGELAICSTQALL